MFGEWTYELLACVTGLSGCKTFGQSRGIVLLGLYKGF
jgi:hypothetical protein